MRLLIAVSTCNAYEERANEQRRTWVNDAKELGIDVKFFIGRRSGVHTMELRPFPEDTILVQTEDDYEHLPLKIQAACAYMVKNQYDFMLRTDDDTLVHPHNLLKQIRKNTGYVGHSNKVYCSGFGYLLSRAAAEFIAKEPWTGDPAEDRWVGEVLRKHGYAPEDNNYFVMYRYQVGYRCRLHWRGSSYGWQTCELCRNIGKDAAVVCPNNTSTWVERLYKEYQERHRNS